MKKSFITSGSSRSGKTGKNMLKLVLPLVMFPVKIAITLQKLLQYCLRIADSDPLEELGSHRFLREVRWALCEVR